MVRSESSCSELEVHNVDVSKEMDNVRMGGVDFKGTYVSGYVPKNAFFISGNVFYRAADETNRIKGYRAYFDVEESANVNAMKFGFGDNETDLSNVNVTTKEIQGIYGIDGVRLKSQQRGVNIIMYDDGTTSKIIRK